MVANFHAKQDDGASSMKKDKINVTFGGNFFIRLGVFPFLDRSKYLSFPPKNIQITFWYDNEHNYFFQFFLAFGKKIGGQEHMLPRAELDFQLETVVSTTIQLVLPM